MEPLFPRDAEGRLRDQALKVLKESAALAGAVHPVTRAGIQKLVRHMTSYYSNLIEGHATHPAEIERAMRKDFSSDPAMRALQIESRAHVEVQELLEGRLAAGPFSVCSPDFLRWVHRELYDRFPDEFRIVRGRHGAEDRVMPGEWRTVEVEVGAHTAPASRSLDAFLARFAEGYEPARLDPLQMVVAVAAAHHRFVWIHPFLDGNGRVVRLFTHAFLARAGVEGLGLWTMSRGLARRRDDYRAALARADATRRNDLDGRGNLSDEGLDAFCRFFLDVALDQIRFMSGLLELGGVQQRIASFAERETALRQLPARTGGLLLDCYLRGEVTRGEAARALGLPERTARRAIGRMLEEGLVTSAGTHRPLRLGFSLPAVGYYFPRLYPEGVEMDPGVRGPAGVS